MDDRDIDLDARRATVPCMGYAHIGPCQPPLLILQPLSVALELPGSRWRMPPLVFCVCARARVCVLFKTTYFFNKSLCHGIVITPLPTGSMLSPGKVLLCVVGLGTGGALLGLVYRRRTRTAARRRLATELRPGLRSMLLGIALGDAFGAGIEFQDAEWIRDAKNVDFRRWVNVRGPYFTLSPTNSRNFSGGMYTDDTEMTAGLMKALLESKVCGICDCNMQYVAVRAIGKGV